MGRYMPITMLVLVAIAALAHAVALQGAVVVPISGGRYKSFAPGKVSASSFNVKFNVLAHDEAYVSFMCSKAEHSLEAYEVALGVNKDTRSVIRYGTRNAGGKVVAEFLGQHQLHSKRPRTFRIAYEGGYLKVFHFCPQHKREVVMLEAKLDELPSCDDYVVGFASSGHAQAVFSKLQGIHTHRSASFLELSAEPSKPSVSETALREALVAEQAHCAKVRQELLDQLNAMARTRTVDIANLKKTIAQHDAEAKAREHALVEQLKSVSSLFVTNLRKQTPSHPNIMLTHVQSMQDAATKALKEAELVAADAKRTAAQAAEAFKKAQQDAKEAMKKQAQALEYAKKREQQGNSPVRKLQASFKRFPTEIGLKDVGQAKDKQDKLAKDLKTITTSIEEQSKKAAQCTADVNAALEKWKRTRHLHDQARKVVNYDNQGQLDRLRDLSLQVAAVDVALKNAKRCVNTALDQKTIDEHRKNTIVDDLNQANNNVIALTTQVESANLASLAGASAMGCWIHKEYARLFPHFHSKVGGGFKGSFLPDRGIVTDCKAKAVARGHQLFALHHGDLCFSGSAKVNFQNFGAGPVTDCSAHGGKTTVQVYALPDPKFRVTTTTTLTTRTDRPVVEVSVATGAPRAAPSSLKSLTGNVVYPPVLLGSPTEEEELDWEDDDDDEYEESDIHTTLPPGNDATIGTVNVKIAVKNMHAVTMTGTNQIAYAQAAVDSTGAAATAAVNAATTATQAVNNISNALNQALLRLTLAQVTATTHPSDAAAALQQAKRIADTLKKELHDAKMKEEEALKNAAAAQAEADKKKCTLQVVSGRAEVAVNTAILHSALANLTLAMIRKEGVDDAKKKVDDAKTELADSKMDLKDTKTSVKMDCKQNALDRQEVERQRKQEEDRKRKAVEEAEHKKRAAVAAKELLKAAHQVAEERAAALKAAEEAARVARQAVERAKARAADQARQAVLAQAKSGSTAANNQVTITKSVADAVHDGRIGSPAAMLSLSSASATAPPVPHGSTPSDWVVPKEADAAKALQEVKAVIASATKDQESDANGIKTAQTRGEKCSAQFKDLEAQLNLAKRVRDTGHKAAHIDQPDKVKALRKLDLKVVELDAALQRARECIAAARNAQLELEQKILSSKARVQDLQPFMHYAEADLLAAQAKVGRAGCWNLDAKLWNTAFEKSHGKVGGGVMSALKFDKGVITECMAKAKKNGHNVFGLHDDNQCFSGSPGAAFRKSGPGAADDCPAHGGKHSVQVFALTA